MKVIFHKDVPRVGKRFDVKDVSDGYAINFLLPNELAVKATDQEVMKLEHAKADEQKKRHEQEATLVKNLKKISEVVLEIDESANDKGHLFKSISKEAIAEALAKSQQIRFEPSHILLDKPIKEVGDHKISVKISDHNGFFTLRVKAK